jgi:uncharacterized membrane protein YozB (DUF420 family)
VSSGLAPGDSLMRSRWIGRTMVRMSPPDVLAPPRTPRSVRLLVGASIVAFLGLSLPYLVLGRRVLRIALADEWLWPVLLVHVGTAGVAIVLGSLQLVPRIRRNRRVHLRIGRTFLALGVVAFFLTALPLALTTASDFGRVGLIIPTLLWPVLATAGFRAIRRRDVASHRAWMTRLFALSFFAITARMIVPLLLLAQLPLLLGRYDGEIDRALAIAIPLGQWLGWIVDLAIAEWLIRRSKQHGRAAKEPVFEQG